MLMVTVFLMLNVKCELMKRPKEQFLIWDWVGDSHSNKTQFRTMHIHVLKWPSQSCVITLMVCFASAALWSKAPPPRLHLSCPWARFSHFSGREDEVSKQFFIIQRQLTCELKGVKQSPPGHLELIYSSHLTCVDVLLLSTCMFPGRGRVQRGQSQVTAGRGKTRVRKCLCVNVDFNYIQNTK